MNLRAWHERFWGSKITNHNNVHNCLIVWSFGQGHLVIFDFGNAVIAHYIKRGAIRLDSTSNYDVKFLLDIADLNSGSVFRIDGENLGGKLLGSSLVVLHEEVVSHQIVIGSGQHRVVSLALLRLGADELSQLLVVLMS